MLQTLPDLKSRLLKGALVIASRASVTRSLGALWVSLMIAALLFLVPLHIATYVSDISMLVAASLATFATFRAAARSYASIQPAWRYLCLSCTTWLVGHLVWSYYEIVLGKTPSFPSVAVFTFGFSALLAIPAFVCFYRLRPWSKGSVLDGALLALALLFSAWVLVMRPGFLASSPESFVDNITIFYPILPIGIVALSFVVSQHLGKSSRPTLLPLVFGYLSFAIGSVSYSYLTSINSYGDKRAIDALWVLGFLLVTIAALSPERGLLALLEPPAFSEVFVPFFPLLLTSLAGAVALITQLNVTYFEVSFALLIVYLGATRQVFSAVENRQLAKSLSLRDQRFKSLVQESSDMAVIVSKEGNMLYCSPSMEDFLGENRMLIDAMNESDQPLVRETFVNMFSSPNLRKTISFKAFNRLGKERHLEAAMTNLVDDPSVQGMVLNCRDVTEREELQDKLRHQAFHDDLTSLPNRASLMSRLREVSLEDEAAVLFCDLDGFKAVNDTLGHAAGNDLLVEVANRLRKVSLDADLVARFGGDEFGLLVVGERYEERALLLGQSIVEVIKEPFFLDEKKIFIGVSAGIALTSRSSNPEELMRDADLAMYYAKESGKGQVQVFKSSLYANLERRLRVEAELRQAVLEKELILHYQPVVNLLSNKIESVEALVRWQHPVHGLVFPESFVSLAEESSLIIAIGAWTLEESVSQVLAWDKEGVHLNCAVNLSPRQLLEPDLVLLVKHVLKESGILPSRLTLEITETSLVDASLAAKRLEELRSLGVKVSLDDFGTGYSSLSNLRDFSVDAVKVDQTFVAGVGTNDQRERITKAVVLLGQAMNITTVAEGIETPLQKEIVRRMGCTYGQGYLFSKPVSAKEIPLLYQSSLLLVNESPLN